MTRLFSHLKLVFKTHFLPSISFLFSMQRMDPPPSCVRDWATAAATRAGTNLVASPCEMQEVSVTEKHLA